MEKKKDGWGVQEKEKKTKGKPTYGQLLHHFFLKGQDFVGRAVDKWNVADALNSRIFSAAIIR